MSNSSSPIDPQPLSLQALRLLLLLAVGVSFYLNLWAVPLFDVDEGAFSEATREMFVRGDFISTFLDGVPRYDKPILIYWLQAASMTVFGVNEFAFRLPSALAATLWVLAVFAFVRRVKDERSAFGAAIITATALEVSVMGKAATADALLNLFIACSMFCVYLYWREQTQRWLLLAFACIGLGFLTKGPVAVLVPLAVSFLFYASHKEFKAWFKAIFNPAGIGLFLLIAMPWYVAQYLKEGDAFIQGFFFKHNVDRFQSSMEQHGGGLLYYIPVVLVAVLPFTSVLLKALSRIKLLWADDLTRFSLLWFVFVLGFFSLSGTKLPHYVLYGMTGAFVLMALSLAQLHGRIWTFLPQLILFTVLLLLPEVLEGMLPGIKDPYQHAMVAEYKDYFSLAYRLFFVAAIMFTLFCMAERRFLLGDKLLASGVVSVLGISLFVLPAVAGVQQGPIKAAALFAKQHKLNVVRWRSSTPSFSVYRQQVTENRLPRPGEVVLTKNKHLDEIGPHEILFQKAGVILARSLPEQEPQ